MAVFPYASSYAFFPNLLPLFPSPKAWLVVYRKWSNPGPAQESLHVFASRAVSWYVSPWWPWRSDLLHAPGSGGWRSSQAGSWETLFLHAPQCREAWRSTQPTPVRGLADTGAAPSTLREPWPCGECFWGQGHPEREWDANSIAARHPFREFLHLL